MSQTTEIKEENPLELAPESSKSADSPNLPHPGDRESWSRRLAFIMLVRVIVFTLILGGTVAANIYWGTPEQLGGPFVTFLFIFIAGLYLLNIIYAVLLRLIRDLAGFTTIQLGCDLLVAALLVNFTGGADSAFVLLFMLSPIGAAVCIGRRAAVLTGLIAIAVMTLTVLLGYNGVLPTVPGQERMPWDVTPDSIFSTLLINGVAMLGVAFLSGYLAEQLRSAAVTMEEQRARIYDLAALNADIIRCLTTGLITVGEENRVITVNNTAADLLGVTRSRARWKHLGEVSPELEEFVNQAIGVRRGRLWVQVNNRRRLLDISVSPLNDHHDLVRGRIINFQDITDQRQLEKQIKQSEHLASLGRITAGIAHEIRNPLGSISTSLEMLQATAGLDDEDNHLMSIALDEIERCDGLVSELLAYARPKPLSTVRLDIGAGIDEIINNIAILRTGDHAPSIRVLRSETGLWVNVDTQRLSQVLWNLSRNAWQAGEKNEVQVRVDGHDGGRMAAIEVTDHGSGIAADHLPHLFEPFFTTRDHGTGLGLATVHQVIEEHGGRVEVESKPGHGSTFRILLPVLGAEVDDDRAAIPAKDGPTAAGPFANILKT